MNTRLCDTWALGPGETLEGSNQRDPQAMTPGDRVRVLIIDDEPSICKALNVTLSRTGFEPIVALSSDAALSVIRTQHVDMLLIDLHLRGDMRGDAIFELAAAHQPHLRRQTLFITGDISEFAYKLIAACRCNFLRKPFDLQDVIDAMHALSPRAQDAAG